MNRIFATIALAALAFTSCIKEDNSYKEQEPVRPGMSIYQWTMNQNTLSMQPANAGMRLAMLLAEADKLNPGEGLADVDLKTITSGSTRVQETLFGSQTTIERQTDGDYLITFSENAPAPWGLYLKGAVLVKTGGKLLSDAGASWDIVMQDLKVVTYSNYGETLTYNLTGGQTELSNAYGVYMIDVTSFVSDINGKDPTSSWSGRFSLTAEDSSLAYSLCAGKDFDIEGSASGATIYGGDMRYDVEGVYRGTQIVSGTQECRITSSGYDTSYFVRPDVRYEWTYDSTSNTCSYRIYYNGYVFPKL